MIRPAPTSWQVTLADLSLILFLVTLAGFAARAETGRDDGSSAPSPAVAPSQALYRPIEGGQPLGEWLAEQPHDPRATLTIIVHHPQGEAEWAFRQATQLRSAGAEAPFPIRIIIEEDASRSVHASLAFDSPREDARASSASGAQAISTRLRPSPFAR